MKYNSKFENAANIVFDQAGVGSAGAFAANGFFGVGTTQPHQQLDVTGGVGLVALSVDPIKPLAGRAVMWMSDGTGLGVDGDVIVGSNDGSTIKYTIIHTHSAGIVW